MYNLVNNFVFLSELKMNQKAVFAIVAVLVLGLGIGLTVGAIITNSKRKAEIADLRSEMQQSEAESQKIISNYESTVNRLNGRLQLAAIEIQKLRSSLAAAEAAAEPVVNAPEDNQKTADAPQDSSIPGNAKLYTVKDGDSPWKIAANQLGNGERYKEILKLNPDVSPDGTNLTVGMKLKLPPR